MLPSDGVSDQQVEGHQTLGLDLLPSLPLTGWVARTPSLQVTLLKIRWTPL